MFIKEEEKEYLLKEDFVSCETCGCLMKKEDSQYLEVLGVLGLYYNNYCKEHRKKYNRLIISRGEFGRDEFCYFGEIEMDENGEPIGYIKQTKK